MAQKEDRISDNVDGSWYVDSQCIDCDLCRTTAPNNFRQNTEQGYSYVFKQPTNTEEEQLCNQAAKECPVEAIGLDA